MNPQLIQKFDRIGARAKIRDARVDRSGRSTLSIDILRDAGGEYFEISQPADLRIEAVDVQSHDRHLLLVAQDRSGIRGRMPAKYLCGHDERHWFVAAVPERPGVRDVATAKDALMPQQVRDMIDRVKLARNARYTRKNRAFVRQGEWFFVCDPEIKVPELRILRHEPIRRGAGKPHFCQELYRTGGERVYVRHDYPNGLSQKEYLALDSEDRRRHRWRVMQRNAVVFVRGYVRHPDHATIWLDGWHRVFMNTETESRAMRNVAFLD